MRLEDQCYLPRLREKAPVNFQIRLGKKDPAARMRAVPSHRPGLEAACQIAKLLLQFRLVGYRKRKRGSQGVFALERHGMHDRNAAVLVIAQQNPADLNASPRQGEERIYDRQPYIVERRYVVLDGERTPGRCPPGGSAVSGIIHLHLFGAPLIVGETRRMLARGAAL